LIVRCIVSAALITLILRKVNWSGLSAILVHLDLRWAAAGSATTFALIAGLALRWRIFLRQQNIHVPYGVVLSLTWAGQFFNSVLPGSTGGDVVKIYQICRLAPDRKAAAASTVFVDRLSALVALLVLAAVALLIDPVPLTLLPRGNIAASTLLIWLVLLGVIAIAALLVIRPLVRATQLYGRIARTLAAARKALQFSRELVAAVALAFAIHLLNFLTLYLFVRALGIPMTYGQVTLMMPVVLFLVMVPLTINGHGLREVILIAYFSYLGVVAAGHTGVDVRETAVALSLVAVANDLLWSLPGGLLYLRTLRQPTAAQPKQ
jgi:hypothetical protein